MCIRFHTLREDEREKVGSDLKASFCDPWGEEAICFHPVLLVCGPAERNDKRAEASLTPRLVDGWPSIWIEEVCCFYELARGAQVSPESIGVDLERIKLIHSSMRASVSLVCTILSDHASYLRDYHAGRPGLVVSTRSITSSWRL